jgi:hypothetical protein
LYHGLSSSLVIGPHDPCSSYVLAETTSNGKQTTYAVFVPEKPVSIKLFLKFFYFYLLLKKLVDGKYFSVNRK